jgi:hypothetical protein
MNTLAELRSGALQGAKRIRFSCGLSEFPEEIFTLADTLEILDLSGNALSSLPDDLPRLHRLRIIFCSDNQFTHLPEVLGRCAQLSMIGFKANRIETVSAAALPPLLRWLILTDNRISQLPAELGRCGDLQKLMLAGNRLTELPAEMAACTKLELLRIAANQFTELPAWLLTLPKLSWLAYAGNPFSTSHELDGFALTDSSPCIAWDQLALKQPLGEGASGIIHQAAWQGSLDDVAVKIFKGALTSDGLPRNEMNACIATGQHPSLIPVLGRIDQHPEGAEGLVMALIDPAYANLAGPPSLESCTRDVYAPDLVLSMAMVLRMALGIASVAAQLHARGIMHGDLYGHNILHCDQGHPVLGDFGAASFYDPTEQPVAEALQRLEVRAFGCLLEELMARSEPALAHAGLQSLQVSCMSELPAERPLFEEVVARLVAFGTELVKEK